MVVRLCTLDQMKNELKSSASGNAAIVAGDVNERLLNTAALVVARRVNNLAGFEFAPRIETVDYPISPMRVRYSLNTLYLNAPLLVLQGVSVGSTTLTVSTDIEGYPVNTPEPFYQLRLKWAIASQSWYGYTPTEDGAPLIAGITGIWGYRSRYATEGWLAYDTLQAGINASVTSLTVADADGADPYGITPRFSQGQLIRIDSEYLEVTGVNTTTNALTVRRGVQGSTAAAHLITASVDSWQVEEDINRVATRQACLLYARRGAFQTAEISDIGTVTYPSDLLQELKNVVALYAYG